MRLFLDIGRYEHSARRGAVEGKAVVVVPETMTDGGPGALLACMQSLPDRPDRERAAQSAAAALRDVYAAASEAAPGRQALDQAIAAADAAVRTGGERGRAAAAVALLLQGRRWYIAHAGHLRAWRYRDSHVKQLTRDHTSPRALGRFDVTRALGQADAANVECYEGELKEGDVFLLTSPAVHDALSGATILGVLQTDATAQQQAETLVRRALAAGAQGYAGACVARVEKLPRESGESGDAGLPIGPYPEPGAEIDGFTITRTMIRSRRYRLYKAKDSETGTAVALRFPDPKLPGGAAAFLREEWSARQMENRQFLRSVALRPGRRSALYTAMEYRPAENLAKRVRRKGGLSLEEALRLTDELLEAVEALHRAGLLHDDIRANSLLYDKAERRLCLPALAVERREARADGGTGLRSSTLSYWAPELFGGSPPSERTDVYAAGVVLYRLLTAKYPYGRIHTGAAWRRGRSYVPLRRYKENLPPQLDVAIARACAPDPANRYATAAEFRKVLGEIAAPAGETEAETETSSPAGAWPWWLAAALAGGLGVYLYFALGV